MTPRFGRLESPFVPLAYGLFGHQTANGFTTRRYLLRSICLVVFAYLLTGLTSCIHRQTLLRASAVSMSVRSLGKDQKLIRKGNIKTMFCPKFFEKSSGKIKGYLDEVVKMAQKQHQIDAIHTMHFFREGGCYGVEGIGLALQSGTPKAKKK